MDTKCEGDWGAVAPGYQVGHVLDSAWLRGEYFSIHETGSVEGILKNIRLSTAKA